MFKLPEHVSEKFIAAQRDHESKKAVFANLSDGDLAASARFWMQHCRSPHKFDPDEPIYDATFWHVIVPELLRRISKRSP